MSETIENERPSGVIELFEGEVEANSSPPDRGSAGPDFGILDSRRVRVDTPPPKPVPVLKLAGHHICTAGNITAVSAQAKAGKSAAMGAMLASLFAEPAADCLGFEGSPPDGKAVIYFDTEQSPYDTTSHGWP